MVGIVEKDKHIMRGGCAALHNTVDIRIDIIYKNLVLGPASLEISSFLEYSIDAFVPHAWRNPPFSMRISGMQTWPKPGAEG